MAGRPAVPALPLGAPRALPGRVAGRPAGRRGPLLGAAGRKRPAPRRGLRRSLAAPAGRRGRGARAGAGARGPPGRPATGGARVQRGQGQPGPRRPGDRARRAAAAGDDHLAGAVGPRPQGRRPGAGARGGIPPVRRAGDRGPQRLPDGVGARLHRRGRLPARRARAERSSAVRGGAVRGRRDDRAGPAVPRLGGRDPIQRPPGRNGRAPPRVPLLRRHAVGAERPVRALRAADHFAAAPLPHAAGRDADPPPLPGAAPRSSSPAGGRPETSEPAAPARSA